MVTASSELDNATSPRSDFERPTDHASSLPSAESAASPAAATMTILPMPQGTEFRRVLRGYEHL